MSRWLKVTFLLFGVIVFFVLIFGVYALPLLPKPWINTGDADAIANQIAGMNYLLTFLATVGAFGGIAFTIFGYYQTVKIPELIEQEINRRMENYESQFNTIYSDLRRLDRLAVPLDKRRYLLVYLSKLSESLGGIKNIKEVKRSHYDVEFLLEDLNLCSEELLDSLVGKPPNYIINKHHKIIRIFFGINCDIIVEALNKESIREVLARRE